MGGLASGSVGKLEELDGLYHVSHAGVAHAACDSPAPARGTPPISDPKVNFSYFEKL